MPLGASWKPLGGLLGASWSLLEPLRSLLEHLKSHAKLLTAFWQPFGSSWEGLGSFLDRLKSVLGASWSVLGASWEYFRGMPKHIERDFDAWKASSKRFAETLKNHEKCCNVLQKSRFGDSESGEKLSSDSLWSSK